VNIYTVQIKAELGNGQSSTVSFTLSITSGCGGASVTAPSFLNNQIYTISNPIVSYIPTAFTPSITGCFIIYTLVQSSGTAIPSTLMSFNANTREL